MSRIGKKPVDMPSGVSASVSGQTIEVKGPKGTRSFTATDDITILVEDNLIRIDPVSYTHLTLPTIYSV